MSSITYFRKNSPYPGDVTKNCALTGSEVDNNFFTLEGRDIKSVELVDGKVVVTLMNGDVLSSDSMPNDYVKDLSFSFDEVNGVLTIESNGNIQTITGFATNFNVIEPVAVNGSIVGNGLPKKPIGISPLYKTGQYRPVNKIINVAEGEALPSKCDAKGGDRYLTIESINEYGYLYNYMGLKQLACRLHETNSPWRIPSKEDWDDMLNAIEPNPGYRNHNDVRSNKYLGKLAGKFLKSKEYWLPSGETDEENNLPVDYSNDCHCCQPEDDCMHTYHGETGCCCHHEPCEGNCDGTDLFGFRALPAGYANEAKDYLYFKERAYFWTSTNQDCRDAYIKVLDFKKCKVLQDILASDNYLSVRLIKDYNGDNFNEREDILGTPYSAVLMPSLNHGQAIWTAVNIYYGGCSCECKHVIPNDGVDIGTAPKKFFTTEWNGFEWVRKELLEGESVVVNEDHNEYRVVNGELVSVTGSIYDDVMEAVTQDMERFEAKLNDLQEALDEEIERSTAKDEEHDQKISDLEQRATEDEAKIQENKEAIDGLTEQLGQTNADLATLRQDMEDAVAEINQALEEEKQAREEKDTELEGKIGELGTQIEEGLAELDAKIEAEKEERQAKDEEIEQEITEFEQDLADETSERTAKDEEIEAQLLDPSKASFDSETGLLTLKSKGETNNVEVQLSFNFGDF